MPDDATAAILVGGRSRRMGIDKTTVRLPDGALMIDRMDAIAAATCARVVVIGENDVLTHRRRLVESAKGEGPLAAIVSLLESGDDERYLVLPCDMPLLTADLLGRLLTPGAGVKAFVTGDDERPRSLPLAISADLAEVTRLAFDRGVRSIRDLLDQVPMEIVRLDVPDGSRLININTPDDMSALSNTL